MRKYMYFMVVGLLAVLVGCQGGVESEDLDVLLEAGRAYLATGEYDEAIAALETVVRQAPDNRDAHFLLGQAYNQTGQLSEAAETFARVLELDPESAAAHHNLGVTYYQLEDLESAIDAFEAALDIDPNDADTHYQLGATYLTLALSGTEPTTPPDPELLNRATEEFEIALGLRENMPEALIGLGNIHLQRGDYDSAIETLRQAIEFVPDSREARYALGGAYAQKGNIDQACETYREFLSLDPPAAWQSQAEQIMASLGCE